MLAQPVTVAFRYTVHQTRGLFALDNPALANIVQSGERRLFCVVDYEVYRNHPNLLNALAHYCEVHDIALAADCSLLLEKETMSRLVARTRESLGRAALPPSSYVLALGDRALIDGTGMAVTSFGAGLRLIRAPTTALGQCETAVGISSDIEIFDETLNAQILAPPYAVINDTAFLATQSGEWRIACAQALKMALARDAAFFDFLETHSARLVDRDLAVMETLIHRSVELRLRGDAHPDAAAGVRDFDAWLSESAEPLAGHGLGPAGVIALGIGLGATYARLAGRLGRSQWDRVLALLAALELNAWPAQALDSFDLWRALAARLARPDVPATVMLPCEIGQSMMVPRLDADILAHSITLLQHRVRAIAVPLPESPMTKATKHPAPRIATPGFRGG